MSLLVLNEPQISNRCQINATDPPSLGSARSAAKLSPGDFPRSCFTPLRPTLAVGARPETARQRLDQCPTVGAGLTMASPFRVPCVCGAVAPDTRLVCRSQTVENNPHPAAHHTAGQAVGCSLQVRRSEVRCTPSSGLSFPLQPQLCGARASGEKTADRSANVASLAGVSSGAYRRRLRLRRGVC
jgi:hypothetical protein